METSSKREATADGLKNRIVWLLTPTWIAFVAEVFGWWGSKNNAFNLGSLRYPLIYWVLGLVVISPWLVAYSFIVLRSEKSAVRMKEGLFPRMLLLLIISLLLSMYSCGWNFAGHPTWTSGYK